MSPNVQLPATIDEAVAAPPAAPDSAWPSIVGMACLWATVALALQAVIWPAAAKPQVAARHAGPGVSAADALALTDEVITALAADEFSSVLLKIELAQKVAQRLAPALSTAP